MELALQKLLRSLGPVSLDTVIARVGEAPLSLHVRHTEVKSTDGTLTDSLVLFKYDQIKSSFAKQECREARGLILRYPSWDVVCYPFQKFFNAGEGHADEIDWAEALVEEKIDGSLIKVWFNKVIQTWMVSTNGTIQASHALVHPSNRSFMDLFNDAAAESGFSYDSLDRDISYMFELCHPDAIVVVRHQKPRLFHIGSRRNSTLKELIDLDIGIERPARFPLNSLENCREAAARLGTDAEGFITINPRSNGTIHRVKIKSPNYVALHHLKSRQIPKNVACATILLTNELSEVSAYEYDAAIKEYALEVRILESQLDHAALKLLEAAEYINADTPKDRSASEIRKYYAISLKAIFEHMPQTVQRISFSVVLSVLQRQTVSVEALKGSIRERFMKGGTAQAKDFVKYIEHEYWICE